MSDTGPQRCFDRVLLTNDDGIDAAGLRILEAIAETLAEEVWVVAPARDRSGASAALTLHDPLRIEERGPRRIAVAGSPADCVILAIRHVLRDRPPSLVLSGVNRGANLGDDIGFSGTIGAALTAHFLGVPALALSQAIGPDGAPAWRTAEVWGPRVIRRLAALAARPPDGPAPRAPDGTAPRPPDGTAPRTPRLLHSINFPAVPPEQVTGVEAARQGHGSILAVDVEARIDMRNQAYFWFGFARDAPRPEPGTDIAVLRRGAIAVTPLTADHTDHGALDGLARSFD